MISYTLNADANRGQENALPQCLHVRVCPEFASKILYAGAKKNAASFSFVMA